MEENENNKLSTDKKGKYNITNSYFSNCTAVTGGAIYAYNTQYLTIGGSNFENNQVYYDDEAKYMEVSGAGGALYYTCDKNNLNCQFDIGSSSNFISNSAAIKGGAIFWDMLEPLFNWN